ncbi:MAG: asparagine--tRNA ligase [Candidatus Auribacterota bacterium]
MKRTQIKDALQSTNYNNPITIAGWVRTKRDSKGGFSFIELNDGSSFQNIQVIADESIPNYTSDILKLTAGCSIAVQGTLVESPAQGQSVEVKANSVSVIGLADPESYPLQKKRHSFEFLRQIAHLRPRTNTFGAIARVRNALSFAIHQFFQDNGFFYLHSPIITGSDCEGAGEMFRVTTFDLNNIPRVDGAIDFSQDFFGKSTNLTVSGQLEAEIYALALGNVYTFGPTFRAENSNTSRHLSEFWMVEPEMAFCDLQQDCETAEKFLKFIIRETMEKCPDEMAFFNKFIDNQIVETLGHILNSPFEIIPYKEALAMLQKANVTFEYPLGWEHGFQAEHERYLTEELVKKPVIIIDFPKEIKAFYMRRNDDGQTVAAMDILFPHIGEIVGGSQREERYDVLKNRILELGLHIEDYWWYMELRQFGSVEHAGFGLGFDRLVQFISGMKNIRDIIPFPRTPQNADF